MKLLCDFLSQGISAAGVARITDAKSKWSRIFWISTVIIASVMTVLMTTRVIGEYFRYPKAWQTKSVSMKELEFPAVTVCGRYLIPRMNAKESKLQYMEELYAFLHSIPGRSIAPELKFRCIEDPLCRFSQFQEECRCQQNPCNTTFCEASDEEEGSCICSKRLCNWEGTRTPDACQFVETGGKEFCTCRKDFEYPLYNPNASFIRTEFDESLFANVSTEVLNMIKLMRSTKGGDMNDMDNKLLPNVRTLDDYSTSFDNLIVSCNFEGHKCIQEDFTTLYSPTFGKCYMFNYVGEDDEKLFRKPKIVKHPGRSYGLHLYLQSERKNMLPLFVRRLGARIVIHDPRSLPFSREGGFDLRHGDTSTVSLRYTEINRLGPPWGHCANDGDSTTSSYKDKPYNQIGCERKCLNKVVFSRCKCYHRLFMSSTTMPAGQKVCTSELEGCFMRILEDIGKNKIKCNCPEPCREKRYKSSISNAELNKKFVRLVKKAKSLKMVDGTLSTVEPEFRLDLMGVVVFYQTMSITNLSETSIYSVSIFLLFYYSTFGILNTLRTGHMSPTDR
ncbi:amiloride-sensitive sodium channel subunit beta [Caerostris darwini]|uniref:Amiloride-sensitive sodium channel subunit beta n=1 Tax=Caerostris darwini TaxID=1538125 RepID=A0AAV4VBL2_9ARAC|nr:amiloride-sensitive sodium channel subunit beta [Caerostris darwini]